MSNRGLLIGIAVIVMITAVVVAVGYQNRPARQGDGGVPQSETPSSTDRGEKIPGPQPQLLQELAAQWPQIEQGPLKHSGEGGHWVLTGAQLIGASTVVAYFNDGLVESYAVLVHSNGSFSLRTSFRPGADWSIIYSIYADSGYIRSTYAYDGDANLFFKTADARVFDGNNKEEMFLKFALLNPDQSLPNQAKPGDISGCDNVVFHVVTVPTTTAPLTAALNALLAYKPVWSVDNKIYDYLGQANLKLQSAVVQNGIAKIYLSGTKAPLAGVCDDPRMLIQITQTARQFATVQKVELYVNGTRETGSGNEQGI